MRGSLLSVVKIVTEGSGKVSLLPYRPSTIPFRYATLHAQDDLPLMKQLGANTVDYDY